MVPDAPISILIDSNVFIAAEDHGGAGHVHGVLAAALLRLAARLGYRITISNGTRSDVLEAPPELRARRQRALSKYVVLRPVPTNMAVREFFPAELSANDAADLEVLSTFATGVATWLVSQDRRLRARARSAGIGNVHSLDSAVGMLEALATDTPLRVPAAEHVSAYEIDPTANIFETLKADYKDFADWWRSKVVAEDRKVIVLGDAADPSGIAVLKTENDRPYGLPDPSLKVCTFKVAEDFQGDKRGELLLKAVIETARMDGVASVYLEVLPEKEDLVAWLGVFGFRVARGADAPMDQLVMHKLLEPAAGAAPLDPLEHAILHGPGHLRLDAAHAVPIRDAWHHRLLPEADPQSDLFAGEEGCGNAIRKAYLCRAGTRKIQAGDGLLFVRTGVGASTITAVGITEVTTVSTTAEEVIRFVGTRTVYTQDEIRTMCSDGPVLAILFRLDRVLSPPLPLSEAIRARALHGPPQSISSIHEEGLPWVRQQLVG